MAAFSYSSGISDVPLLWDPFKPSDYVGMIEQARRAASVCGTSR